MSDLDGLNRSWCFASGFESFNVWCVAAGDLHSPSWSSGYPFGLQGAPGYCDGVKFYGSAFVRSKRCLVCALSSWVSQACPCPYTCGRTPTGDILELLPFSPLQNRAFWMMRDEESIWVPVPDFCRVLVILKPNCTKRYKGVISTVSDCIPPWLAVNSSFFIMMVQGDILLGRFSNLG